MENFFSDNPDILWHFEHLELDEIIANAEDDFTQSARFDDAPTSAADAREGYRAVLDMLGAIAAQEIAPLAAEVDLEGARFEHGEVTYARGTRRALAVLARAGLMGFTLPRTHGGLNIPGVLYTIATEIVSQADASLMNLFGLQDIAETIREFASEEQKAKYLPKFASGEVTGAMILTEPDAGSDLQAVRLKAVPQPDGAWKLYGVKRFITNGCGDVSLVLARTEDGSTDGRGLSMLLCEKCPELVVRRIENKLGIHGSPTCELQFNGVPAELVGQRRLGLIRYVMSLMNGARVAIAAQSVGIAQAAYEEALKYARERTQFKKRIIEFPQVYDMLARMKSALLAARAITYEASRLVDLRRAYERRLAQAPGEEIRAKLKEISGFAGVLTPIAKAYASEMCNQVAYDAIQIHGGAGFMRDFNVERLARDARITSIYEGTTQLQVIGALPGVTAGTLGRFLDTLAAGPIPANLSELAALCGEARAHLARALTHLKAAEDKTYLDYMARPLVDLASEALAAHLFLRQAARDAGRALQAEKFIRDALPRIRMRTEVVTSGDRLTIEKHADLL
ncbi:MAG TPA: acyl-CoA dehydrogenase family protein [Planctomycetota bacterium]|nr:acyl-CoA dehydrogenase family protein [Planctomycetota bacterium]OQC21506.1 MAG: Acyl-CoA dehydrogenase [Planctomycetes bacterium ADurb.Bin069]NMD34964.1 acyl-CoA dehydrogenase [Planctomycetota bacterium]HNS00249.1 acyl-CoA dehydrogenase family protein [Planctomycetota bacterium]HNU26170.1 acyl-CoA dehydrogenase family protein [Planctomycetota bacterium]